MCICSRPEGQESRSLLSLPGCFVNKYLKAIDYAEAQLEHPPNIAQINVTIEDQFGGQESNLLTTAAVLWSLFREELIFCDESARYFSRKRSETMLSYSEIFNRKFGGGQYGCLKSGQIVVKRAKTVNLTYLLNTLSFLNKFTIASLTMIRVLKYICLSVLSIAKARENTIDGYPW